MRNIHNGQYRPSRKPAARIAGLMTFVMIVSDCLPGLAAVPERTFRENAVSVQAESNTEENRRNPATGSDGERKEENSLYDDQETGILSRIAGVVNEGTYAGGFRWSLDRDGLLTVSGDGDMPGTYRLSEIPWDSYRDRVKKIVLEEGITGIGQYLFSHCENLTSLEIPESVSHIGEYAFYNCANLQEVILPDTAETIDVGAFDGCPRLPEDMPLCRGRLSDDVWWKLDQERTLTVGGAGPMPDGRDWTAFPWFSCSASIEEIVVEEGITTVGSHAFESCENVSAVSLPQGITVIGTYGFWGCESLTAIEIPESVIRICEYAFLSCVGLTDVIVPDSVTTVEGGAFSNCPGLPGNVPVAKDTYSRHLRWVVTSDGVMTVSGDGEIPDMGGVYTEGEDGETYKGNWNSLWISIEDSITKIIIEEGITAIGRSAFGSCRNLVAVVLPESLTKIGDTAFYYCLKLSDIKLPAGLRHIGRGAFMDTSITSAVIPENVEFLSQTAFPEGTEFTYEKTAHPTGTPLELTANAGFEVSSNAHRQNYVISPVRTVESNLWVGENGNLFRTECITAEKLVIIEEYSPDCQFIRSWQVPMELPLFGGFFEEGQEFYLVFGQTNPEEQDDAEVIRAVRYSKDMKRLDSVSLYGQNTSTPFQAGSLRMDKKGQYLYIHTCHEKYRSAGDGRRHQENMTMIVNTEAMAVALADHGRWDTYVSHSFNQFIKTADDLVVAVDQGDGLPERAVIMMCSQADDMGAAPVARRKLFNISGESGQNYTGVTLGGLEVSGQCYLTAGSSVDQKNFSDSYMFNIFLSVIDKDNFEGPGEYIQVTDYKEDGDRCGGTPVLVKISDDLFALMWEEVDAHYIKYYKSVEPLGTVKVAFFDGRGNQLCEKGIGGFEGSLSDCQPIVYNDQVIWYVTDGSDLTFYSYPAVCPDKIENLEVSKVVLKGEKTEDSDTKDDVEDGGEGTGGTGTGTEDTEDGNGGGNTEGSGSEGSGVGSDSENTGEVGGGIGGTGSGGSGGSSGESGSTGGGSGSGGSGGSGGGSSSGGSGGSGGGSSSGGSGGSGGGPGSSQTGAVSGNPGAASGGNSPAEAAVLTGTWKRDSTGWWLEKPDKDYPRDQWARINGVIYHFNEAGYMDEGWILFSGQWYYLLPESGAMATGWIWVSDRWYYLNSDGSMAIGWISAGGKWYYLNGDGAMATGWILVGGKWYYLNGDGSMATGWILAEGKWYYLGGDGAMLVNTTTPDHYMVGADGAWIP